MFIGLTTQPPPLTPFSHVRPRQAHKFTANDELREGADLWHEDMELALAKYGHMSDWDVSDITSMRTLFGGNGRYRPHFNEDLSRWNVSCVTDMEDVFFGAKAFTGAGIGCWDVSSVTNMSCMLNGATSFNHRLGGHWATSTASKSFMFGRGCPGSIEGKINSWNGTPTFNV